MPCMRVLSKEPMRSASKRALRSSYFFLCSSGRSSYVIGLSPIAASDVDADVVESSHRACQNVLPAKTHRRAATSNTKSREAPRTAGGPWSLGRRPAKLPAHVLAWFEGVPPDLYLVRKVKDCSD